jgi:hypothetical protein
LMTKINFDNKVTKKAPGYVVSLSSSLHR